jgi:hypothetical protein
MNNELNEAVLRAFQTDIIAMMDSEFDERVAIIQDPETGEETLHKISGEEISESEFYALSFFELGWNSALRSFEEMGTSQLAAAVEEIYGGKDEDDDIIGDTD